MGEKSPNVSTEMNEMLSADVEQIRHDLIAEWLSKIHCGDAVELMNKMPAESVGLCVTSPPYNLKNSTGNGMKDGRGGKWSKAALMNGYEDHHDNMPHEEYATWQREGLRAMLRVTKNDGAVFY